MKKEEIVDNYQVEEIIYEVNETEVVEAQTTEESRRSSACVVNNTLYRDVPIGSFVSSKVMSGMQNQMVNDDDFINKSQSQTYLQPIE